MFKVFVEKKEEVVEEEVVERSDLRANRGPRSWRRSLPRGAPLRGARRGPES